ncbi:hypothetical protein Pan44_47160 [Caulifigura coniformis]|uniref:Protein NO VEIN C-terminal domain-containing protein n=1 Tax=Caulifigura coniformis TaxID=2527983 RepID=A0A517SKK1_9PLAN|nr:hypothetical protein [Caulifigura coniformis]QDT56659.1 hypothetical protein Pan44_47160 [Caulifigura coniformis]
MPKILPIAPHLLHLAGEYRVCSELQKRGIFATVTFGTHKGVDIFAIDESLSVALRIEVKTSQRPKFVTGISQKKERGNTDWPDFWVLARICQTGPNEFDERFFVLSHAEIADAQSKRNADYSDRVFAKKGTRPDPRDGVDNVKLDDVLPHENCWNKIADEMAKRAKC